MTILFRPQFWIDLEDGVTYLARQSSESVAARWHSAVMQTTRLLTQQPGLGRPRPDLKPPGIRSFRVNEFPRYLVFYMENSTSVEFLRVKHGMMNLPALFSGPKDEE